MTRCLLLSILLLLSSHNALDQDRPRLIGEIEFFGYAGIDQEKVRAALPFHEQESFVGEEYAAKEEQARAAVIRVTGRASIRINAVCCDQRGNEAIFIGLSGKTISYNPKPHGRIRLPEKVTDMYARFMQSLME